MDQKQLEESIEQFSIEIATKMCASGCDVKLAKQAANVVLSTRQIVQEAFAQNPTPRSRSNSAASPRDLEWVKSILEYQEPKKKDEPELRTHDPIPQRLFNVFESAEIPAPEE